MKVVGICGMRWAGQVTALARLPREAAKDPELERLAGRLVRAVQP